MNDDVVRLEDRRRAATNRLVVLDIDSIGHFWSEIVDPDDLVSRSVLIRSLLEARREGDVFLIGCDPTMGWAMTEVFPGAVLFLGDGTVTERRPLTAEFVRHYRSGRFGEVCVVTGDETLAQVAQAAVGTERPLRLLATRDECAQLLAGVADGVVMRPDFRVGEAIA